MHDDDIEGFEPVVSRLHAAAEQPVDPATARRVLGRARQPRVSWVQSTKLKVAAGIAGGFLLGSAGLASAGALPAPAQRAAHAAFKTVGVHVPPGHDRYNGPECGDVKNHGEYVRSHPDDPEAGKSPCGKPNRAVNKGKGNSEGKAKGDSDSDDNSADGDDESEGKGNSGKGGGNGKGGGHGKPEKDKAKGEKEAPAAPAPKTTTTTVASEPAPTTTSTSPTTTSPTTTSTTLVP